MVLKVQPPARNPALGVHEVELLRRGAMILSSLVPARDLDVVARLAERGITAFSTDTIPRIRRAQSMDVLSSMASLAGYRAVILAAGALPKYFPMLMTAAGTALPARVFVIGAGVAGLQAVATARRLGAVVEATDTRPAVKIEVESLGARFVGVETTEEARSAACRASTDSTSQLVAGIAPPPTWSSAARSLRARKPPGSSPATWSAGCGRAPSSSTSPLPPGAIAS